MKHLMMIVVLLGLVIGCGGSLKVPVRESSGLIKHLGSSTVALVISDEDGVRPYCSGVWISSDEILTAGHCAEAIAEHLVGKDEGPVDPMDVPVHYIVESEVDQIGKEPTAIHLGYVKGFDDDHDLALIKAMGVTIPAHDYAQLAVEMPSLGEQVWIVGHPKGLYWSYITGVVSSYRGELPIDKTGPFVQVSAPVYFGNSGGGVFDGGGHLVGIASMLLPSPNTALFIHVDSINKFLRGLKKAE